MATEVAWNLELNGMDPNAFPVRRNAPCDRHPTVKVTYLQLTYLTLPDLQYNLRKVR